MKFKQSAITPEQSGKLGAVVFSKNQYGPYEAMKRNPPHDRTQAQQNATGRNKALIKSYSTCLSDEQYVAWKQFSLNFKRTNSSGTEYTLGARDVYVSCNSNLMQVGLPMIYDAPQNIKPQDFSNFTLETFVENGLMNLNLFFKPEIDKDTRILIFATHDLKNCISYFKPNWFRRIGYIDSNFKSGDSVLSIYQSRFQYPAPQNYKIAFHLRPISAISGVASSEIEISASFRVNSQI